MFKRILAVLALAAILAACSPNTDGGGTSPGVDTSPAPIESIEMSPSPS
jgi:hypothetical protein